MVMCFHWSYGTYNWLNFGTYMQPLLLGRSASVHNDHLSGRPISQCQAVFWGTEILTVKIFCITISQFELMYWTLTKTCTSKNTELVIMHVLWNHNPLQDRLKTVKKKYWKNPYTWNKLVKYHVGTLKSLLCRCLKHILKCHEWLVW